jgi:hypothetical protein
VGLPIAFPTSKIFAGCVYLGEGNNVSSIVNFANRKNAAGSSELSRENKPCRQLCRLSRKKVPTVFLIFAEGVKLMSIPQVEKDVLVAARNRLLPW